jgi:hypothetical protein
MAVGGAIEFGQSITLLLSRRRAGSPVVVHCASLMHPTADS